MGFVCQEFRKGTARMVRLCTIRSGLGWFKQLEVGEAGARDPISKRASSFTFLAHGLGKTEASESDGSLSRSCVCHSPPESKFYIGREALNKLQKLSKPQFAHLRNGKERSAPCRDGCEAEGGNCQKISRGWAFCVTTNIMSCYSPLLCKQIILPVYSAIMMIKWEHLF